MMICLRQNEGRNLPRANFNKNIFRIAKNYLYFAAGELSFGEADYHSAAGRLSFAHRAIIISPQGEYIFSRSIDFPQFIWYNLLLMNSKTQTEMKNYA